MTAPIDKSTADQMRERDKVTLSPADRLRARMAEQEANPVVTVDLRPDWIKLTEQYEVLSADSTVARTGMYAEALVEMHDAGQYVPGELFLMARAFLQPRTYDQPRSRTHDPATSKAAEPKAISARSQSHKILRAYAARQSFNTDPDRSPRLRLPRGLTAPEAALVIGKPGAYRRTPELHHAGLLELVKEVTDRDDGSGVEFEGVVTRKTVHGADARVFDITPAGLDELRRLDSAERKLVKRENEREARKRARGNRRA